MDIEAHEKADEAHEKADEAAKDAAKRPSTQRCPERFTSLTHVRHKVTKLKWNEAMH